MRTPRITPTTMPSANPNMGFLRVNSALCRMASRYSRNAAHTAVGAGSTNAAMPKKSTMACHTTSRPMMTSHGIATLRRRQLRDVMSDGLRPCREPGLVAHPRDFGANGVHEVDEGLVERAFHRARPRQPHAMGGNDAAGPRAHDEDDVGEVGGFAQVMGHEHAGELAVEPQLLQHAPELLAGKGIERAERLIQHQQLRI